LFITTSRLARREGHSADSVDHAYDQEHPDHWRIDRDPPLIPFSF